MSEPSSESDNLSGDPNYNPDDGSENGGSGGGSSDDDGDSDDGSDSDDDGDSDYPTSDDDSDEDYVPEEHEDDDDDEYMAMVASQPPWPDGVYTENGVTYVDKVRSLRLLNPQVHILALVQISILQRR
jgi:hypothetical protein